MTEPLPCPFCGHVGVTHSEGSTFRWLSTECDGCGAKCGEERIDTLSKDQGTAIERAKEVAITTWNTRFTPFPPQQQAEPVAYLCENGVGHRFFLWKKPSDIYKLNDAGMGVGKQLNEEKS